MQKLHLCLFSLIPVLSDHERVISGQKLALKSDFLMIFDWGPVLYSVLYECTCASSSSAIRDLIYWRGSTCNPFGKMFNGNSPGCDPLDSKSSRGIIVAQFMWRYNQAFGCLVGNVWVLQRTSTPPYLVSDCYQDLQGFHPSISTSSTPPNTFFFHALHENCGICSGALSIQGSSLSHCIFVPGHQSLINPGISFSSVSRLLSLSSGPRFGPQRGQQGLEGPKDKESALTSLVGISEAAGPRTGLRVVRTLVIYR